MKLFDHINIPQALRGKPYTPEEIDKHEYAERIWATVAECKREAQELCQQAWGDGHWKGQHDNRYDKG